ncbi:hypothetical protein HN604_01785 [archaeon]|jgi:hypothetical protein|nr:hypothetical protein [archaeon]MBT6182382.1 hypothetical protein [archaeon]MBT6606547.1 hypothetical protein [archaeon]MBT7251826.1 hypothetical protein [archaeon]MBT7660792.1 hypothetical protein [archaeon]
MDFPELISKSRDHLVEQIRDYSRSQKELWQQVPWLSYEADGRSSTLDPYVSRPYHDGTMEIHLFSSFTMDCPIYVDLSNGELVRKISSGLTREVKIISAENKYVFPIANSLERIDAQRIIDSLEDRANGPLSPIGNRIRKESLDIQNNENPMSKIYTRD